MREAIIMIKWCLGTSLLSFVFTYFFSVHDNVDKDNSLISNIWLSDGFLSSVFCGIFASLLVVALCEIRRYMSLKETYKTRILSRTIILYTLLKVLKISIEDFINHKDWVVSENLLDSNLNSIKAEIDVLKEIDYETFKKSKNSLAVEYARFKGELCTHQEVLQAGLKLKIVLNIIKQENLEAQLKYTQNNMSALESHLYTLDNPKIAEFFNDTLGDVNYLFRLVDCFNEKHCNAKIEWNKMKELLY